MTIRPGLYLNAKPVKLSGILIEGIITLSECKTCKMVWYLDRGIRSLSEYQKPQSNCIKPPQDSYKLLEFKPLGINAKVCFFHYTQCIWRKVQDTGLQVPYKENNDINKLVRRTAVLPLLPVNDLENVWFYALEDLEEADTNTSTLAFTDYITSYWAESNRHLWNHYQTDGPRTTNHMEGWHSKLKKHL